MTDRNKGILYMVLTSLFFALMAASVKLSGDLPTMEKVFFRNLVGFMTSGYLIYKSKESFKGNNTKLLLYRSIFGLIGIFFYFYAIDRLPLANAVVLNQMNPFFVLIFSFLFLGEIILKLQVAAIFIALTGVLFIVRPGFDYTVLPAVIGLLSAVFAAAAYTTVRHLRLTDSPQTIIFYFTGITTLTAIPFMIFGEFVVPNFFQFLALISVGVFATLAQFFMTHAYRYGEAGDLSIYSYGNTVFSIFIGIILWKELPDLLSFIGVACILLGAYLNYRAKQNPL
ncbi:Permease of the drug/metabolite transporter (DMT) superfamily [Natronincola peptidivorans]|uniref:Permease of the drug/metabolite transporter (DMT) superfamily n=1 Tax=Natronincola peptidivorans TaxID=426128 RepID=A0A1I0ALF7_9FIRM|nr:DMT family transporter [Natronincola peptidivorans]SES95121.1 Permease of the drug/metabolite transporter (DMT) superfamily [Natronincola peptidivorans]